MSTLEARPSTISSDMHLPTAGPTLNPVPLIPTARYRPSMPGARSIIRCPSGVLPSTPLHDLTHVASSMAGIRGDATAGAKGPAHVWLGVVVVGVEVFRRLVAVYDAAESEEGEVSGLGPEIDPVGGVDAGGVGAVEGLGAFEHADGEEHAVNRQVQADGLAQLSSTRPRPRGLRCRSR